MSMQRLAISLNSLTDTYIGNRCFVCGTYLRFSLSGKCAKCFAGYVRYDGKALKGNRNNTSVQGREVATRKRMREARDAILSQQTGLCAVSRLPIRFQDNQLDRVPGFGRAVVDHCHGCEGFGRLVIRGILENGINSGTGLTKSPTLLRNMAAYLERHWAQYQDCPERLRELQI